MQKNLKIFWLAVFESPLAIWGANYFGFIPGQLPIDLFLNGLLCFFAMLIRSLAKTKNWKRTEKLAVLGIILTATYLILRSTFSMIGLTILLI